MLYPGGGTYWTFNPSALARKGLPAGMKANPFPTWTPGSAGLTRPDHHLGELLHRRPGQRHQLADDEAVQARLHGIQRDGYPGSGTRPDYLTQTEQANLSNDGTTGVGAVWNLYYAMLPNKVNVIAYISSVADQSGGNDSCQASDASLPLTDNAMDSWSATRWISRIAVANNLLVGGENSGCGLPPAWTPSTPTPPPPA
jgi:hypothetical protein